ncbi:MAG: transposase [Selenomonadaceae bacterium]|nr:transposase [Selenomonadaceae bacterium]
MYFVGIDIAKHFHEADIIDDSDKVVLKKLRFSNSHDGYNKLMDSVRKLDGNFVFTMEAIGHYWFNLYAHLRQDNHTIHVINPIQSDALRNMYIRKLRMMSLMI